MLTLWHNLIKSETWTKSSALFLTGAVVRQLFPPFHWPSLACRKCRLVSFSQGPDAELPGWEWGRLVWEQHSGSVFSRETLVVLLLWNTAEEASEGLPRAFLCALGRGGCRKLALAARGGLVLVLGLGVCVRSYHACSHLPFLLWALAWVPGWGI